MTKKRSKPPKGVSEPEAAYRHEGEEDVFASPEWEAWYKRNGEALQESFRRAEEEYARGEYYTIDEVMVRIRARAKKRQARKAKKA